MKAPAINLYNLDTTQAVPFTHLIPDTSANRHFYKNGLSKLIPRLTLQVHSDIEKCYDLWDKFSPKQTIFDLWDFRYAFYEGYKCKPYFYTIYEGKTAIGVLPLWHNKHANKFEWFGGWYHEENTFFVEDENLIDFFLAVVPSTTQLNSIKNFDAIDNLQKFGDLGKGSDLKYFKNIDNIKSVDSFLKSLKKKDRHHIKKDYERLVSYGVRMDKIVEKNYEVFNEMISMNKSRFDGEVMDMYPVKRDEDSFRAIVKNAGAYDVNFLHAKVQNRTAAIDMIVTYKDSYYQFAGANDVNRFNGIGHFMVFYEVEEAINSGYGIIDCLQEDHTWKHRYFDSRPVYNFVK